MIKQEHYTKRFFVNDRVTTEIYKKGLTIIVE